MKQPPSAPPTALHPLPSISYLTPALSYAQLTLIYATTLRYSAPTSDSVVLVVFCTFQTLPILVKRVQDSFSRVQQSTNTNFVNVSLHHPIVLPLNFSTATTSTPTRMITIIYWILA